MNKIGFFQDTLNSFSMARLITFIFALWAVVASGYVLISLKDYAGCIATFTAISGIAATFKLIQKQMEIRPQP